MQISRPQVAVDARLTDAWSLVSGAVVPVSSFEGRRVHAVAGIGNPQAFFAALRGLGIDVDARALPDHAGLTREDIGFPDDLPVLMTEKDAVKCRALADSRHWAVRLDNNLSDADEAAVSTLLDHVLSSRPSDAR